MFYTFSTILMSKDDVYRKSNKASEIMLSVKGRKTRKQIPRPVWFSFEGNTLHLLPVEGSDTQWYNNVLADPEFKISVDDIEIFTTGKTIADPARVREIAQKFRSKYGEGNIKKYYPKINVAVEVVI